MEPPYYGLNPTPISEAQTCVFARAEEDHKTLHQADVSNFLLHRQNNSPGALTTRNNAHEYKNYVLHKQDVHRTAWRLFPNMAPVETPFGDMPYKCSYAALEPFLLAKNLHKRLHELSDLPINTPIWKAASALRQLFRQCRAVIDAVRTLQSERRGPSFGDQTANADAMLRFVADAARETIKAVELLETLASAGLCPVNMVPSAVELYAILDAGLVNGAILKTAKTPLGAQAMFVSLNGAIALTTSAQLFNNDAVELAIYSTLGAPMDGSCSTSNRYFERLHAKVFHHLNVLGMPELEVADSLVPPILLPGGYRLPECSNVVKQWLYQRWRQVPEMLAEVHWGKAKAMAVRHASVCDYDTHLIPRGVSLTASMDDDSNEFQPSQEPVPAMYAQDPLDSGMSTGSYSLAQDNAAAAFYAQDTQDTCMSDGLSDAMALDVANIFDTLGAANQEVDLLTALGNKPADAFQPGVYAKLLDMGVPGFDVSRFLESSAFSPCTPSVHQPQQVAVMATLQGRNLRSRRFDGASGSANNPIDLTVIPPEWNLPR